MAALTTTTEKGASALTVEGVAAAVPRGGTLTALAGSLVGPRSSLAKALQPKLDKPPTLTVADVETMGKLEKKLPPLLSSRSDEARMDAIDDEIARMTATAANVVLETVAVTTSSTSAEDADADKDAAADGAAPSTIRSVSDEAAMDAIEAELERMHGTEEGVTMDVLIVTSGGPDADGPTGGDDGSDDDEGEGWGAKPASGRGRGGGGAAAGGVVDEYAGMEVRGSMARFTLRKLIAAVVAETAGLDSLSDRTLNYADLATLCFHLLDIQEGRGERTLFAWFFVEVFRQVPLLRPALMALLPSVPHYGCWRTLGMLYGYVGVAAKNETAAGAAVPVSGAGASAQAAGPTFAEVQGAIVDMWAASLIKDAGKVAAATAEGKAPAGLSLAAKWTPSLDSAANKRTYLGEAIMARLAIVAPEVLGLKGKATATAGAAMVGGGAASASGATAAAPVPTPAPTGKAQTKGKILKAKNPVQAARFAREMGFRKLLSKLRAALDVVEVKMSGRVWATIEPSRVPSLANNKYKKALQNKHMGIKRHERDAEKDKGMRAGVPLPAEDSGAERRSEDPDRIACADNYQAAILRTIEAARVAAQGGGAGKDGAPAGKLIKGKRNQIHELVATYMSSSEEDPLTEAMWADLLMHLRSAGKMKPAVPIVDVSGSMSGLPMTVAIAMGILMSQLQPEGSPFRNKMITFHESPTWVDLTGCTTLFQMVKRTQEAPWGMSTNFALAMSLILEQAKAANLQQEAIPSQLFVFSDMQFDSAVSGGAGEDGTISSSQEQIYNLNDGKDIRTAFSDAGLVPPTIVYWNLRSSVLGFQADAGTPGIALMSGFSQECLRDFMEEGDLGAAAPSLAEGQAMAAAAHEKNAVEAQRNAWEKLNKTLSKERYDRVRRVLATTLPGYSMPAAAPMEAVGGAGDASGDAATASTSTSAIVGGGAAGASSS